MFNKKENKQQNVITNEENFVIENEEYEEKGSVVNTIVNAFLVFAIILAAVCTYVSFVSSSGNGVPSILGIRPFSIQTESMYPTLQPGDLIISTAVEPEDIRVDDIITYWTVINGERVLNTHRVTDIYNGGNHLIFATKGDNNTIADALTVHESEIVGIYRFRLPGIGKFFDFLQTGTGFFLIIVLPVFMFFIYHLVQFFKILFEYQNIKNRIKYEQEREITEDLIEQQKKLSEENNKFDREEYEKELREKLKLEILAEEAKKREKEALEAKIREQLKAEMLAELKAKNESVEAVEETVGSTEEVTETAEEVTEDSEESVETAEETVGSTEEVTGTAEEVNEDSEESVETAEEVTEDSDESVETVEETVDSTEEVTETAEEVTEDSDESVETVEETVDSTEEVTETAEEVTENSDESVEAAEETVKPTEEVEETTKSVDDEIALREKMIEEELKKREAAMLEKLREELKAQLMAEMVDKAKEAE